MEEEVITKGSVASGVQQPCSWKCAGVGVGLSSETYRFEPLHSVLADVHAPGLLHLHMSQVLQGTEKERVRNLRVWSKNGYSNEAGVSKIP